MLSWMRQFFATPYSKDEGKLVRKIDFFILTFCCLSYFMNYLDRSNLANAYVSGMQEDLNFVGDQFNQINTCFTVGYVVGQVPSNLSLHYIKPRHFFPVMMVAWALLTMVTACVQSPGSIMAIRLLQGLAESSTFVGTHYVLGAWYTERELGRRSAIFTASGLAGTMVGGFIQTGIHTSMDGLRGLAGWRWLFIVDGLMALPVALYGLLLFPDTPAETTAFYLSPVERALAVSRVPVLDAMNLASGAVNAWWSLVFYGASMAPWFTKGMYAMIAASVALAFWAAGLTLLTARAERMRRLAGHGSHGSQGEEVQVHQVLGL